MMNKLIIILVLVLGCSFVSCDEDKYLEIKQHGVITVENAYQNSDDDGVNSLIAAVYFKIRSSTFAHSFGGEVSSSVYGLRYTFGQRSGDFADYDTYVETANNPTYKSVWSYYYTIIYWCNMIIENVPNNKIASDNTKNIVVAEARAIRAIMMMQLVQLWGNPPLANHIMTGLEGNTPAAESWDFIEKEMSEVAELLPSKTELNGQSAIGGRLTKEAVYAYLGKAYLWQKKYDKAAKTLHDKVISTGLYKLVDDFEKLNSSSADFSSEYLWESEITEKAGYENSQTGMFDVVNFNWPKSGVYYPNGIYSVDGWGNNTGFSENFGTFMQNHETISGGVRSKRYKATIVSYDELIDPNYIFSYSSGKKGVRNVGVEGNEGYFRVKFLPISNDVMGVAGNWTYNYFKRNECYMRYAEVLLNYAEAVAMGGTNGTSLTGLEALNLVRVRAGLSSAPALDMNNEEYGIKSEKRAEFVWEGDRFIDLIRWGDAPTVLANCGKYTPKFYGYLDNTTTVQSKENWNIVKVPSLGDGFIEHKHELFPIPSVEINNNPNLVQNPGW